MVRHLDAKIGQIVAALHELKIADNTLILFLSDNGGTYEAQIGGLKGGKTDLHEGGIRVPMIACWPRRIAANRVIDTLGHTNDVLPTICAAAGVTIPPAVTLDGIDLLPLLTATGNVAERSTVFWQLDLYEHLQRRYPKPLPYATEAARQGKWKLLAREGMAIELFDIEADRNEEHNVLAEHPELAAGLEYEIKRFLSEPRRSWKKD